MSVIIPAYNRESMIARAVRSALEQTPRPPAEVLVVDDGSSDGTAEAARAAGATVVVHERNQGEGAARNTGIANASQEWVGLLDSDDEWLPSLLSTLWPVRGEHTFVAGASLNVPAGADRGHYAGVLARAPRAIRTPAELIYPENYIAASGSIVRREALLEAGGYRTELRQGADMDVWIRLLEQGTGLAVPTPVTIYHMHDGQITTDLEAMASGHERVALAYADRPWWSPARLEAWRGASAADRLVRQAHARQVGPALRTAAFLARDPRRPLGAVGIAARRWRLRRRSMTLESSGASAAR